MTKTVTALYENRIVLEDALHKLDDLGIREDQIGVVMNDQTHGKAFAIESHDKSSEGFTAGATFGGIVGGILSAVAGAGVISMPGLNLMVAGPIVAGLAGAAVGAAAGSLVGGLIGMGIPEHEAKLYEGKLRAGHILLAVQATDSTQASRVREMLKGTEAYSVAA